jgi:DNA-binding protein HU-beta
MNKAQLVEYIQKSGNVGETKTAAERALATVLDGIEHGLKKDKNVALVGFGSFSVRDRKARTGRNPQTGEQIKIKASKTVGFKCGKALKDSM